MDARPCPLMENHQSPSGSQKQRELVVVEEQGSVWVVGQGWVYWPHVLASERDGGSLARHDGVGADEEWTERVLLRISGCNRRGS